MGSWDAGSVESNRSGKLAPSLTELALLCWDQVGTVPRAQRALPAALPPASPTAWAGPGNSAHGHPCPALGSGRHQTMWPGGGVGNWPGHFPASQSPSLSCREGSTGRLLEVLGRGQAVPPPAASPVHRASLRGREQRPGVP